ncbi:MAG: hypothetical protein JST00_28110 [Deltaproteobacteria bacterium]|nr:hypothetical protein [Deltaproteobacteria bacterium]
MEPLGRTCLAFAALALVATACGDEPAARDHGDKGDVVATEPPPSAPFSPVRISLATAHAASNHGSKGGPPPALTPAPPVDQCNLAPPPLPVDLLREPPEIASSPPTTLGLSGLTANARVQPHGSATRVWFEYGPTLAYGSKTPAKPLGPKLAAHYRESWDTGLGGWRGGSGTDLVHHPGGFARYSEPTGTDYNHVDGIGLLHLVQYFYPGYFDADAPTAALGGGDPDLRDAKVEVTLRGQQWNPRTTELLFWAQGDPTHGKPPPDRDPSYANWAHTGHTLTRSLLDGAFHGVSYRLDNDTNAWTFAGGNVELQRQDYVYAPLDELLRHVDIDFFHVLAFIDDYDWPTGSIDFDHFQLTYRNHSLVIPSNGGRLRSASSSPDDPRALTDGHRHGEGKMWRSAPSPSSPPEVVYTFDRPVTIDRVQLHQHPDWPTKRVEVLVSRNGATWTSLFTATMPEKALAGPSFAYLLATDVRACAVAMKVRLLDGYRPESWGLGEIEAFGTGAVMETDDDWYGVNADIVGLAPGATYHVRAVAMANGRTVTGPDVTFVVPATAAPLARTLPAARVMGLTAKLEGRLNTFGREAQYWFEWGDDTTYGSATSPRYTGPEITERNVVALLEGLAPGRTVHYRLVVAGPAGTTHGADASFVAQ